MSSAIRIGNARSHNLQGVSCHVPLHRLTVVTGVSGSGKSSLAFDTLYAEGQRRYVTSLSTYARQFLERLPRPEVDFISSLPPAIAIEQRNRVTSARSTVGTATEILDHLRLLFARVGEIHCRDCDRPVPAGTVQAVTERVLARWDGQRIALGAKPGTRTGETARQLTERLLREGYGRILAGNSALIDLGEEPGRGRELLRRGALLLVDRLALRGDESRARLAEAIATAFSRGGSVIVLSEAGERVPFREGSSCDGCGRRFPSPEPALFSFNSPLGACPECQGFGRVPVLDVERVVPDPRRSLAEHAIAPFDTPTGRAMERDLLEACAWHRIPTDRPWARLSARHRRLVIDGDGEDWYGVRGFFEWLEGRRYKVQARVLIARYRRFDPCPACQGVRLRAEALGFRIADRSIGDVSRMTISELDAWLGSLSLTPAQQARSGPLLVSLGARVRTAHQVGLGYLSLLRQVRTLSGGEAQRIQLATALGGTLTATLYVLDEPTIGLHARDVVRLLSVLRRIRDRGNTVVVVEHAPEIVEAADHVIDLGPGAGRRGGRLVVEGSVDEVRAHPESATGRALRGEIRARSRGGRHGGDEPRLRILGARAHNLRGFSVDVPLHRLVVVSGVSGAGKSTLVRSVLVGQLRREPERGACDRLDGAEAVADVVVVDTTPPVRSPRSNPGTVSKAFDVIRRRFAETRQARSLRLEPGWFSFNVAGGRCPDCEGSGQVVVDMQFLEDVRVPCESCQGSRYRPEARAIHRAGLSIVDVLACTLDEVVEAFADDALVRRRLDPLRRAGLGYLTLGQPLSTLSGGEIQRLRLALALSEPRPGTLYVFDEPTTGLHPADVEALLGCLDQLLEHGGSVVVVEHNLDVIRAADWVIDLGPEGGPAGGRLVVAGTPETVAGTPESRTGAALRGEYGFRGPAPA